MAKFEVWHRSAPSRSRRLWTLAPAPRDFSVSVLRMSYYHYQQYHHANDMSYYTPHTQVIVTQASLLHASLILLPQGYVLLRRCARNPEERQQLCVWIDPQGSQIFEGRRITKHYIRLCLKTNLNIMCLSLNKHARYIQMRKMRDPNMYTRRQDSGWSKIINVMCFFMSQK